MKKAEFIIGIGNQGAVFARRLKEKLRPDSSRKILNIVPGDMESDDRSSLSILTEKDHLETRKTFCSQKERFFKFLGNHFHDSVNREDSRVGACRYILLCLLKESPGSALPLELAWLIREFHREQSLLPLEIEAVIVLPSFEDSTEEKALAYACLRELNHFQAEPQSGGITKEAPFDFIWFADPSKCSSHEDEEGFSYLLEVLALYLSTESYNEFHQQALSGFQKNLFQNKASCFSSFGLYRLYFPWKSWVDLLGAVLAEEILSHGPLSPLVLNTEVMQKRTERVSAFFDENGLEDRLKEILQHDESIEDSHELIAWMKEEKKKEKDVPAQLFDRARLIIEKNKEALWGNREYDKYIKSCAENARKEAEALMDKASNGILEAELFLSLLLEQKSRFTTLPVTKNGEESIVIKGIPSILFGQIQGTSHSLQDLMLKKIATELKEIYERRYIPWNEPAGWEDLYIELKKIFELEKTSDMLKDDEERARELYQLIKEIVEDQDVGKKGRKARTRLESFLHTSEQSAQRQVKKAATELEGIEAKISSVIKEIKGLGWKILLPHKWGHLFSWAKCKQIRSKKVREVSRQSHLYFQKTSSLLPYYLLRQFYDRLTEAVQDVREEVTGFINLLLAETQRLRQFVQSISFPDDRITYHVAKKDDLSSFYYHKFSKNDLPALIEDFHKFLPIEEPIYSKYYRTGKRAEYLQNLDIFNKEQFLWLGGWSVEKVMFHLDRYQKPLTNLSSNLCPMVHFKKYPEDHVRDCLYIGLEDKEKTKLSKGPYDRYLKGTHQFYSTGERCWIHGIKIIHGHTIFSLEGIPHLRQCYQKLIQDGKMMHPEDMENLEEIFPE